MSERLASRTGMVHPPDHETELDPNGRRMLIRRWPPHAVRRKGVLSAAIVSLICAVCLLAAGARIVSNGGDVVSPGLSSRDSFPSAHLLVPRRPPETKTSGRATPSAPTALPIQTAATTAGSAATPTPVDTVLSVAQAQFGKTHLTPVFDRNFSDPQNYLPRYVNNESLTLATSVNNGKFHLNVTAKQGCFDRNFMGYTSSSRFYMAITARAVDTMNLGVYGLYYRYDGSSIYLFLIDDWQNYSVAKRADGKWSYLIPWSKTTAIEPWRANQLAVIADGPFMTFYVNGQLLRGVSDDDVHGGESGAAVNLEKGDKTSIEFDDFKLFVP